MSSLREFIEDSDGRGSAARLNMIVGVCVGSIVVLWLTAVNNLGGEIFGAYMLATGGVYSVGKWRESVQTVEQIRADSPNQPSDPAPIPPATVINVGQDQTPIKDAKDVSVQAKGNVTVKTDKKRGKRVGPS